MERIFDYLEEWFEDYLEELKRICRQPSVAAQNLGMAETAQMVKELLEGIGAETQLIETGGYPLVYGELRGRGERTLTFYNHYDVQPPEPLDEWDSGPFAAEVRQGKLFARGAADNKGNLVARVAAVEAYRKVHGELPLNVKFIVEGEEEIGSPHLGEFADRHPDLVESDGCIWEFGDKDFRERPQVYLGLKGILYVELRAAGAARDLHSSWGTVVPNPAWRLTRALTTLKDEDERVLIPGFYDQVRPPSAEEREALSQIDFDEQGWRERFEIQNYLLNLSGEELLERHLYQPTCTICGLESGYIGPGSKTVLPSRARAKLDFRLVPDQDPEEVLALLKEHLAVQGFADLEVIAHSGVHPARTPLDDPLVSAVVATARRAYGKEPQVYPIAAGSGPMYPLCQRFAVPAVSTGLSYWGSGAHAPNEHIRLTDFAQGMKHIALIIQEFAGRLELAGVNG